jgi:PAS domain S-box-containing protein
MTGLPETPTPDDSRCLRPDWSEAERIAAVSRYDILDTPAEPVFDDIVELAAEICEAPIAVVNFIGDGRQWFKAEKGIGQRELPLDVSICRHAILQPGLFVVPDLTKDPRFAANPLVAAAEGLRFYAGAQLETPEGLPLGTVCVLDKEPRPHGLTERQRRLLRTLARQVMSELELRLALVKAERSAHLLEVIGSSSPSPIYVKDRDSRLLYANPALLNVLGVTLEEAIGRTAPELVGGEDGDAHVANDRRVLANGETLVVDEFLEQDGQTRIFQSTKTPIRGPSGEIDGVVGISLEITEERRAQETLKRQAETIDSSRRLLDAVIDAMPVGVIVASPSGALTRTNAANTELWGQAPRTDTIEGYSEWVGYWPETGKRLKPHEWAMARALTQGEVCPGELVEIERFDDGGRRIMLNSAAPVRDAEGEIVAGIVTQLDVTDRVRAEQALAKRSTQLQGLADAAVQVARAADLHAVLDEITAAARSIIGAHQGVVSLTRGPDWSQAINAVALTDKYAPWRQYDAATDGSGIYAWVCSENRPVRMTQAELEAHPRWRGFGRHAADHPPMRGWLAAPLIGRDGRNLGLIQLSDKDDGGEFDETDEAMLVQLAQLASAAVEQSVAETALRSSEERFRAAVDAVEGIIWTNDAEGRMLGEQPGWSRLTGQSRDQYEGFGWSSAVHPDDAQPTVDAWLEAVAEKRTFVFEHRVLRADGQWRRFAVRAIPVLDSAGEIREWVGVHTDITELRAREQELRELNETLERRVAKEVAERSLAEEALRHAQKMEAVGQLTGGVAHDFNNLLTVITGGLDIIRRSRPDEVDRIRRATDMATKGAERAVSLTARLLAFSRRQPLKPRPSDLNVLVRDMTDLLHRTLGEQIELEGILAPRLWAAEVDQHQLESAILNLAVNARDAMPEGGKLTIETANTVLDEAYAAQDREVVPGQYVLVCVSDSGSGMSKETLAKVFEPFFTTKEVGRGTGLGLSMVYGFVKQSGGHVTIYSEEGVGTTVRLYFPRYMGAAEVHDAAPTHAAPASRSEEVVLVVEDNEDVRAYSVMILRELGYGVIEAVDADSALAVLGGDTRVDLLFTDVVLPGPSGRVIADEALKLRPELKVLFTTGYSRNAIIHHGRLDAGVQLISKPFTYEQLAQRVRDLLDSRPHHGSGEAESARRD